MDNSTQTQLHVFAQLSTSIRTKSGNLLVKILGNIINDPNNSKYRKLHFMKICNKLKESKVCIDILFSVGFETTSDGQRLVFDDKKPLNTIKSLHKKLLLIISCKHDNPIIDANNAMQPLINEGYTNDEAKQAIQMSVLTNTNDQETHRYYGRRMSQELNTLGIDVNDREFQLLFESHEQIREWDAQLQMSESWNCEQCPYLNDPTHPKQCQKCGNIRAKTDEIRTESNVQFQMSKSWICATCTYLNDPQQSIHEFSVSNLKMQCQMCGNMRQKTDEIETRVIQDNNNIDDLRVERIKYLLNIHRKWIEMKVSNEDIVDIYDLINESLSPNYNFNRFLNDYKFVFENKHLLGFSTENKGDNKEDLCDASCCYVMDRHERSKEYYTVNGDERNALFFNAKHIRSITAQQCLDSAHCFVYHGMRINTDKLRQKYENTESEFQEECDEKDIDLKRLIRDRFVEELTQIIETTLNGSIRFRRNDARSKQIITKFMSTNTYKSTQTLFNKTKQKQSEEHKAHKITDTVCVMDGLIRELVKYDINPHIIDELDIFILENEYDTDCLIFEFNIKKLRIKRRIESEIRKYGGDLHRICGILNEYISGYLRIKSKYSIGIRYFYWDFYKNNADEVNVVVQYPADVNATNTVESNRGYKLMDWYIAARYSSFKVEMISNTKAPFSLKQWETTMDKATIKYHAWNKCGGRKLYCGWFEPLVERYRQYGKGYTADYFSNRWDKLYEIAKGTEITISHLMSLLFYTNYTVQSYEFSATFRRIYWNESDESLKHRHSYYAHWARLLRETVEAFGISMSNCPTRIFYHGIGEEKLFEGTSFYIHGPCSTTVEFEVAQGGFSGSNGLVVDIVSNDSDQMLFNCQYWSDFQDENERFFIGCLQPVNFKTIHHLGLREHYEVWITAIAILQWMIKGYAFDRRAIKQVDVSCLSLLISNQVSVSDDIPEYITRLFKSFVHNVQQIVIHMSVMNWHKNYIGNVKRPLFGYCLLKPLFYVLNDNKNVNEEMINFKKLLQLFNGKVQRFVVICADILRLNELFMEQIISAIKVINSTVSLRFTFKEFVIVKPIVSIPQFIQQKQSFFNEHKWKLEQTLYTDAKRRQLTSIDSLSIKPY